jgi:hypothetical protein
MFAPLAGLQAARLASTAGKHFDTPARPDDSATVPTEVVRQ